MNLAFYYTLDLWLITTLQFLLMMACILLGRKIGNRRVTGEGESQANGAIVGSVYALMGLLLAFTFGMSGGRYEKRKDVIVEETNCIGTAILRLELYADSVQPKFRTQFKQYLEARIAYYNAGRDTSRIREALNNTERYADELWNIAAANSRISANLVASNQMVPALNQMFDIANTRFLGEYDRTPASILTMLFCLSFATAFILGYSSAGKGRFDIALAVAFCFFTSLVVYFIIDLDKPRSGMVTMERHARAIVELRKMLD